jgi:hypothetical protein
MHSIQAARGKGRMNRKFAAMRAKREWLRLNPGPLPDEGKAPEQDLPAVPYAAVSIRIGKERISFRVQRWDAKTLMLKGKRMAASSIGKRIALVLENML